jgi:transcriptional regulator with XRE-family HTH domain
MTYTDYIAFDAKNHRLLQREELIIEVTESLARALIQSGMKRSELAAKLGVSKGFVSQVLGGGRNLTLRTIADVADALDCTVRVDVSPRPMAFKLKNWQQPQLQKLQFPGKLLDLGSGPASGDRGAPTERLAS